MLHVSCFLLHAPCFLPEERLFLTRSTDCPTIDRLSTHKAEPVLSSENRGMGGLYEATIDQRNPSVLSRLFQGQRAYRRREQQPRSVERPDAAAGQCRHGAV